MFLLFENDADDYDAIEATMGETARGRAFLVEYARRVRESENQITLTSVARLEKVCDEYMALLERAGSGSGPASSPVDDKSVLTPEDYRERIGKLIREVESLIVTGLSPAFLKRGSDQESSPARRADQNAGGDTQWIDEIIDALRQIDRKVAARISRARQIIEPRVAATEQVFKSVYPNRDVDTSNSNNKVDARNDRDILAEITKALRG